MSTVRTCADCTTQYALDLAACPHCGSSNYVGEGGVVNKRLPLFATVSCPGCGRGPFTLRLMPVLPGLIELPTLACASCGSRVPVTWPPEEEPMSPKITIHGGATNAREADVSPAADASQPPQVVAEDDLGRTKDLSADIPLGQMLPDLPPEASPENAEELPVVTSMDYAGMSLSELRAEADKRGVPSYGSKAQITDRLKEHDAEQAAAVEDEGE